MFHIIETLLRLCCIYAQSFNSLNYGLNSTLQFAESKLVFWIPIKVLELWIIYVKKVNYILCRFFFLEVTRFKGNYDLFWNGGAWKGQKKIRVPLNLVTFDRVIFFEITVACTLITIVIPAVMLLYIHTYIFCLHSNNKTSLNCALCSLYVWKCMLLCWYFAASSLSNNLMQFGRNWYHVRNE